MVGLDEADRLAFGLLPRTGFPPRPPATLTTCRKRWACDPKGRRGRLPPRLAGEASEGSPPVSATVEISPARGAVMHASPSGSPARAARRWSSTTAMRAPPSATRCRRCAITTMPIRWPRRAKPTSPHMSTSPRSRRAASEAGAPPRPLAHPGRLPLSTRPERARGAPVAGQGRSDARGDCGRVERLAGPDGDGRTVQGAGHIARRGLAPRRSFDDNDFPDE